MSVSSKSAGAKLLWLTALASAGLVASATAATVYAASDLQRVHARLEQDAAPRLDASRDLMPLRALTDSLVAPLGEFKATDGTTLAQVVALVSRPSDSATWIAHPPADTSPATAMATYRGWTRTAPQPAFWGSRPWFPGVADSRSIPVPDLDPLKRLSIANEASADSALLSGDTETALMRARENIAGARHLLWQPRPSEAMVGRTMLFSGAKLLARVALQAQQPTLHESAQRLVRLVSAMEPFPQGTRSLHRTHPNDSTLQQLARDVSLHPATRFLAIELMVESACRNTREVLFGPTDARHAAIDEMIDATRDIPRLVELRPAFHRTLDRLDQASQGFTPEVGVSPRSSESTSDALLRLVVPQAVQARIDACRASGV